MKSHLSKRLIWTKFVGWLNENRNLDSGEKENFGIKGKCGIFFFFLLRQEIRD